MNKNLKFSLIKEIKVKAFVSVKFLYSIIHDQFCFGTLYNAGVLKLLLINVLSLLRSGFSIMSEPICCNSLFSKYFEFNADGGPLSKFLLCLTSDVLYVGVLEPMLGG